MNVPAWGYKASIVSLGVALAAFVLSCSGSDDVTSWQEVTQISGFRLQVSDEVLLRKSGGPNYAYFVVPTGQIVAARGLDHLGPFDGLTFEVEAVFVEWSFEYKRVVVVGRALTGESAGYRADISQLFDAGWKANVLAMWRSKERGAPVPEGWEGVVLNEARARWVTEHASNVN